MFCTLPRRIITLVVSGVLIAVMGFSIYVAFPSIMKNAINKKLVVNEKSETYKYWKDVPVPIYIHFYFFHIVNPDEVWNLTNKPILEELGPYTFREGREKINLTWNSNGTVTYKQVRSWFYQPDRTNGSLDDIVTTLNVPMVAAAAKAKQMNSSFVFYTLEYIFDQLNCTWFIQKPVRELLFEGYNDELMKEAKRFMNLPYDKFGWFYKRNETDDGELNMYTGLNDIMTVGEVYTWNGNESVSAYSAPCNMINGSAGDLWPPNEPKNKKKTLFVTDICRSLSFTYLKKTSVRNIKAYRYWADDTQLDNGKYDPSNRCFCSDDICLPAGGINVSSCKFDAPAVVSYPHFLFADSIYSDGVIGMKPNPQKHSMYLDIVPEMGIPINVAARMQINIVFESVPGINQFENITKRIYFPVLWFSETAEAGDDILSQLNLVLNTVPLISNIFSFIMVGVGSLLVMAAFVLSILYALGKIREQQPETLSNVSLMEEEDRTAKKSSQKEADPPYKIVSSK